ncbi:MAG: hypothetical protein WD072_04540, partial [Pirellulales bacterium]
MQTRWPGVSSDETIFHVTLPASPRGLPWAHAAGDPGQASVSASIRRRSCVLEMSRRNSRCDT